MLGADAAVLPDVPTISATSLKNITGYTDKQSQWSFDPEYAYKGEYAPGGSFYQYSPWAWGVPRNNLEHGTVVQEHKAVKNWDDNKIGYTWQRKYSYHFNGVALNFHDPKRYLNTLRLIDNPDEFIEYLLLAPLAGFRTNEPPIVKDTGLPSASSILSKLNIFQPKNYLPRDEIKKLWNEVIVYDALRRAFELRRASQIEDRYDLQALYDNTGKLLQRLPSKMRDTELVTGTDPDMHVTFPLQLELAQWQIDDLMAVLNDIKYIVEEGRKTVAERVIELSDPDATIKPTSFSTDSSQNPYLVYQPDLHSFVNVAHNASITFKPAAVAADPETKKYWDQVPAYEAQHARVYETDQGLMSIADIDKYNLDRNKVNWIPWLAAGAAVAYAATEML